MTLSINIGLVLAQQRAPVISTVSFEVPPSLDRLPVEMQGVTPRGAHESGASPSRTAHETRTLPRRHEAPAPTHTPSRARASATPGHPARAVTPRASAPVALPPVRTPAASTTPANHKERGAAKRTQTPGTPGSAATPGPLAGARHGGTRSWRNNNPGNIEYGAFARAHGATGSDGRFAIFPDEAAGVRAQRALLFEHPSYRNSTIGHAISRWAPSSENDTRAYAAAIASGTGTGENTRLSELTSEQQERLLATMRRIEGWRPGHVEGGHPQAPATPASAAPATPRSSPGAPTPSEQRLAQARANLMRRGVDRQ